MKKIAVRISLFVAGFLFGMGLAKTVKAQNSSLLWEVSGNGLENPSYVFGTIHLACEDDIIISPELRSVFDRTEQTILELDMDDPQLALQMQQNAIDPQMRNFSSDINSTVKAKLDTVLARMFGAGLDQLGVMRPFSIYSLLATTIFDCENVFSFEGKLSELSTENEQELIGVETVQEQFSMVDQIPREEQIIWIERFFEESEAVKEEMKSLMNAYRSRNIEQLHDLFGESAEFGNYLDLFLYDRNKKWIPILEEHMKMKSSFIAVGAGHLGSEDGVIALLKKEGYSVKPLDY